jgi:hypothetical protein
MEKKDRELLRVYDQEGQHKTFAVPNEITCTDVIVMFGKKIHGFQASQFELCVEYKGGMFLPIYTYSLFLNALHYLVKSCVHQLSFPYSLAKELEEDAPDDKDRKTGVSKVKFYLVDSKSAAAFPVLLLSFPYLFTIPLFIIHHPFIHHIYSPVSPFYYPSILLSVHFIIHPFYYPSILLSIHFIILHFIIPPF